MIKINKKIISYIVIVLLVFSGCSTTNNSINNSSSNKKNDLSKNEEPTYIKIDQELAKQLMDTEDVIVIDVRTEEEYAQGHIEEAVLLPLSTIGDQAEKVLSDKNKTILVYCRSGNRSKTASKELINMGYTNINDFGGINTWKYDIVVD